MNVAPGETERVERVMLRVKAVAALPAVGDTVAISVVVAVAAPLGDVPLMTGPLGDVPDDCLPTSVWANVPASIPVAEHTRRIIATTNRDTCTRRAGVGAM
jgi:hypothetical protein